MKIIVYLSFLLSSSLVSSSTLITIYEQTISIGNDMSMTIQLKESDGPIKIPLHTHPNPGTVYLIEGKVQVNFDGDIKNFYPDDSWIEPAQVPHSGETAEPIKYFVVYHHPTGESYINN